MRPFLVRQIAGFAGTTVAASGKTADADVSSTIVFFSSGATFTALAGTTGELFICNDDASRAGVANMALACTAGWDLTGTAVAEFYVRFRKYHCCSACCKSFGPC